MCVGGGEQDQRRLQRDRQLDLSRALESSRQNLAAAARRIGAPQWCSQLVIANNSNFDVGGGGVGGSGHRGFLFELFEIRQGPQETRHSQAIASLLGENELLDLQRYSFLSFSRRCIAFVVSEDMVPFHGVERRAV